jgi:hypothetical protein
MCSFDIKDKTESLKECVFEVVSGMCALWDASVEVGDGWRRDSQT